MAATLAVILKGYPRLSESFIAQEIRALERAGFALRLFSLRLPTDKAVHPVHREIEAPVVYLPEYLYRAPLRLLRGWVKARRLPGYAAARRAFHRDWRRDPTPNRGRRFGQACVLAAELPGDVGWLYAHFLHTPASVARYAALMTGLPWSISAHAKDIWTTPEWEKREKLAEARWLVTCTAHGRAHLAALAPTPERAALVYHGLDPARFPEPDKRTYLRDGSQADDPVRILSVGRAVEKKGYEDLLAALARLPADLQWRLVHVGGGPRRKALTRLAARLGLGARIAWLGGQPQERVLAEYRAADLFVLASRIARDGDRDGLPNVLMEAQSQRLPCVASGVAAIPELIRDGETGLLVPPGDSAALAAALERSIREPDLRQRLGETGAAHLRSRFTLETSIGGLIERFEASGLERRSAEPPEPALRAPELTVRTASAPG